MFVEFLIFFLTLLPSFGKGFYSQAIRRLNLSRATSSAQVSKFSLNTYGENNFGDIMGGCETSVSIAGAFTPMERVVISANGNLQRIMSAYYGAPVYVEVLKCDPVSSTEFTRKVNLLLNDKIFCTAIGSIVLYSDECKTAIEEKNVGVGQLFRFLGVLPSFNLLGVGRNPDGALWREYELSCPQLRCRFVETFAVGFLDFPTNQIDSKYADSIHSQNTVAAPQIDYRS